MARILKKTVLLFLFSLLCIPASLLRAQQSFFINHNNKTGLPSNTVYYAMQDSHGFLWFGTDAGACRYDGHVFKTFTPEDGLTDNEVFQIKEDSKQRLWFLTYNGKICYLKNDVFYNSSTDTTLKGIEAKEIYSCFFQDSKGRIWLGTIPKGLYVLFPDGSSRHFSLPGKNVYQVWQDEGKVWFLANDGIYNFDLRQIDSPSFQYYPDLVLRGTDGSRKPWVDTTSNKIYITPRTKGLVTIDYKKKTIRKFFDEIRAMGIHKDKVGKLSFYYEKGLIEWSDEKESWRSKTILSDENISYVFQDQDGGFWITTLNKGVFYSPNLSVRIFSEKDGLKNNNVIKVAGNSRGDVWSIFPDGSYSIIDDYTREITCYPALFPKGNYKIDDIKFLKDTAWFGVSALGIIEASGNYRKQYFPDLTVKSFDLKAGRAWVATGPTGVKEFLMPVLRKATGNFDYYNQGKWVLEKKRAFSVFADTAESITWIGTDEGLVSVKNGKIENMSFLHPYLKNRISRINKDKNGNFWFLIDATGIVVINSEKKVVSVIDNSAGIEEDKPKQLFIDKNDFVWILSNHSLYNVNISKSLNKLNKVIFLPQELFNDVWVDAKNIWIASSVGLILIPKNTLKDQLVKAQVMEVFVNSTKVYPNKNIPREVPYNQNNLRIKFTGISFNGDAPLFRYKIKQNDPWNHTQLNQIDFYALPPGSYSFRVQARNANGSWSRSEGRFDLLIRKPFWQEWWFISIAVAVFLLITVLIIWKIYQERYRKVVLHDKLLESELKALTAQMNPHFIFNTLNTVQRFFVTKEIVVANKLLSKFGTLMRNILDNTSKSFISIEDEVSFLKNYLEIEQTRFNQKFSFVIEMEEGLDPSRLIPSMIIQPFVENAIIHGLAPKDGEGCIKVNFIMERDSVKVIVDDNGVGRKNRQHKSHVSRGINLIRERLSILNSKNETKYGLKIIDKEGDKPGTRVELSL